LKKILIIRFSSIGDIILTTPVIRCVKEQINDVEIHYVVKNQYRSILAKNPYLTKIFSIEKNINEIIPALKKENYDHIIDLHKNLRSKHLIFKLGKQSSTFNKINFKKWIIVNFKINLLPKIHIVDRYLQAVKFLNVKNDFNGLDYFIPAKDEIKITELPPTYQKAFIGFVIGSKHVTKQLPTEKTISICKKINQPIVLLGGKEDHEKAEIIKKSVGDNIFNACGQFNINQSASLVKQANKIIANDTGLMHIAAAFKKEIISVWGNTIPEFGMYPYFPKGEENKSKILEIKNLSCRPCSKLGFKKCPKKHFDCMNKINEEEIVKFCE